MSYKIFQATFIQIVYGDRFPFDLISKSIRPNSLSILDCIIMLIVDCVLYFMLTIYFDNVIQGEYGRAKPFWFFLSPSYWSNGRKDHVYVEVVDNGLEMETNSDYETVSDEIKPKVALK